MCTCERVLPSYKCLNDSIRQEYARLEANRIQNRGMRRGGYGNNKERIDWILMSRDWLSNWYWVVDEEMAICSWGLEELHYSFELYSLIAFFVFLD